MIRLLTTVPFFFLAMSFGSTRAIGELITNPGNDLALVGGEISGWTEIVGVNWTRRTSNPSPQAGDAYFFAGAGAIAELAQTIDGISPRADIASSAQKDSV